MNEMDKSITKSTDTSQHQSQLLHNTHTTITTISPWTGQQTQQGLNNIPAISFHFSNVLKSIRFVRNVLSENKPNNNKLLSLLVFQYINRGIQKPKQSTANVDLFHTWWPYQNAWSPLRSQSNGFSFQSVFCRCQMYMRRRGAEYYFADFLTFWFCVFRRVAPYIFCSVVIKT